MKFLKLITMLSALMALKISTAGGCKKSAIHDAVLHQNVETFDNLMEKGENINAKDCNGKTPLMATIRSHKKDWFHRLMQENVNIELADNGGFTALHCAAKFGDGEMCDSLLRKNTNVNVKTKHEKKDVDVTLANERADTSLNAVAKYGHEQNAILNAKDKLGYTPLMTAIYWKKKECFDRIMEEKDIDVTAVSYKQMLTALLISAKYGDEQMCDDLLEKGANVNAKGEQGITALMISISWENKECVDRDYVKVVKILLKNNAEVGAESESGYTAMKLARKGGNREIIEVLNSIEKIQSLFESNEAAALHVAAWFGDEKLCERLLKKGANVNEKNNRNETALIVAARENKIAVVRILLKNHAKDVESEYGTALQIARKKRNHKVVEILERIQKKKLLFKLSNKVKKNKLKKITMI